MCGCSHLPSDLVDKLICSSSTRAVFCSNMKSVLMKCLSLSSVFSCHVSAAMIMTLFFIHLANRDNWIWDFAIEGKVDSVTGLSRCKVVITEHKPPGGLSFTTGYSR